jgi:mRNA interferase HigB
MRILSKRTLREFWEIHGDGKQQLLIWYKEISKAEYQSAKEVVESFASCRSIGNNRYIFNIKGNNYRLVLKMNFDLNTVWIRFIGTHEEYNNIDPHII